MATRPNKPTVLAKRALTALQVLQKASPPDVVIQIGADSEQGGLHKWRTLCVPFALHVDADAERLDWVVLETATQPGWHVVAEALEEADAEMAFYKASNPDIDGVLAPDFFASWWPNLQTRDTTVQCSLAG